MCTVYAASGHLPESYPIKRETARIDRRPCSDEINSHCYLSDTDVAKVGSSSTHQVCIRYKNSSF